MASVRLHLVVGQDIAVWVSCHVSILSRWWGQSNSFHGKVSLVCCEITAQSRNVTSFMEGEAHFSMIHPKPVSLIPLWVESNPNDPWDEWIYHHVCWMSLLRYTLKGNRETCRYTHTHTHTHTYTNTHAHSHSIEDHPKEREKSLREIDKSVWPGLLPSNLVHHL